MAMQLSGCRELPNCLGGAVRCSGTAQCHCACGGDAALHSQGRADAANFRGESPTYSGAGDEGAGPNGVELPEPDMVAHSPLCSLC